jgi:glycerol-3-phosphate dehydrogenase (NAD(P)+)
VLSGPSFAIELARELPTAVSIASRDPQVVERVQAELRAPYFRLYGTDDVVGVEIGGALKNIIAIAAGVVEGLGLGHNALAALITRGLAEMSRLACAAGATRETLSGSHRPWRSGADLHRTSQSQSSRGHGARQWPCAAGCARWHEDGGRRRADDRSRARARGAVWCGGADRGQVAELLNGRKDARTALSELMIRPQRAEVG